MSIRLRTFNIDLFLTLQTDEAELTEQDIKQYLDEIITKTGMSIRFYNIDELRKKKEK